MANRKLRWLCGALAYLVFLGLTVGLGLEVLVRLVIPQVLPVDAPHIYRPDEAIGWSRVASVRATANTGERNVDVCTDAAGDRVSCLASTSTQACTRNVVVIGDSFVEALAVPFEETAWARLAASTGACVAVAGVGGYEPSQYVRLARARLALDPPDLVIAAYYAGNDLTDDAEKIPPARAVWKTEWRWLPRGLGVSSLKEWVSPLNQFMESRSHAYVALRFALRNALDPGDVGVYGVPRSLVRSKVSEKTVRETVRSVRMIRDALAPKTHLIVTVVPVRNQVTDPSGQKLRSAFPGLEDDLEMDLVQRVVVPEIERIEGVEVIDLLPSLRRYAKSDAWGVRDTHLSPAGHAIWFDALLPEVKAAVGSN